MNEFDTGEEELSPNNVQEREVVEQDISDREIAKKAKELIGRGRKILLSWPEFQSTVSQKFIHREKQRSLSVKFQRGIVWFDVDAGEDELEITWADNEDALKEDGWNAEGGRIERIHSRTIGITYEARPFRSSSPRGSLFYEGHEIKAPTRTFTVPANTRAVVEQIEKGLDELGKL